MHRLVACLNCQAVKMLADNRSSRKSLIMKEPSCALRPKATFTFGVAAAANHRLAVALHAHLLWQRSESSPQNLKCV